MIRKRTENTLGYDDRIIRTKTVYLLFSLIPIYIVTINNKHC